MLAESLKLKPDELDRPFVAWYSSPNELKLKTARGDERLRRIGFTDE